MAKILRTTKVNKHWHLIIVDNQGQILLSVDNKHTHEAVLFPDPITGEPRIAINNGGEDQHTHDTQELEPVLSETPKNIDDKEVLDQAINLFKHAVELERDSREKGYESDKFFEGEHWTKEERQALNAKNRASQVYNYTQAFVDSLSGLARQNRLDPRAYPTEGSDDGVADILTIVLSWIAKRSGMPQEEIRVFEDEVIPGRGLFHIDISQRRNPLGDVIIEHFMWSDGYFGEHSKLDASDATHCHKAKWVPLQTAQSKYPHVKDELESQLVLSEEYPEELDELAQYRRELMADEELIDKAHRKLRLIEHEIVETRIARFIAIPGDENPVEVDGLAFRKAETIPDIQLMEFPKDRIRIVVTVGTLVLKNYYPDRPYDGFSLIPVYAYRFNNQNWCGKVEAMKDAQREINKRGSQAVDIVNRMLGQGYFYDDETFSDDKDRVDFQRDSGKPGFMAKIASTQAPPIPAESPQFPMELLNLHRQNVDIMQSVSNIPPAMAGKGTGYESGDALSMQKSSGMVGNERIFDNFILSKQTLFRKVFKMVQKFYSKERIARLVLSAASDTSRMENARIGGREIPQQRTSAEDQELMQYIVKLLETSNLDEYDITIGEQPLSPTAREAQFRMWLEAQNHGMQVPPGMLVELSSLPNKGKWARQMEQMQQARMQMEQQKFTAEMAKAGRISPVNQTGGNQ